MMRGYRLVIPEQLRSQVLEELHKSHFGIVKVKALARAYVWWPQIDQNIESLINSCVRCAKTKDFPSKNTLIPWEWPSKPWSRLHMDYLGPIFNHYVLVVIDSHSKWIEAVPTKSMTSAVTIKILRELFARFGLPEMLVADNYSAFLSDEFSNFLKMNKIEFKSGAPYSPRTNGAAENAVRLVKRALITALGKGGSRASMDVALQQFLIDYRNTKHLTTGVAPAEALLGRLIRNRFELMRPPTTQDHVGSTPAIYANSKTWGY